MDGSPFEVKKLIEPANHNSAPFRLQRESRIIFLYKILLAVGINNFNKNTSEYLGGTNLVAIATKTSLVLSGDGRGRNFRHLECRNYIIIIDLQTC